MYTDSKHTGKRSPARQREDGEAEAWLLIDDWGILQSLPYHRVAQFKERMTDWPTAAV